MLPRLPALISVAPRNLLAGGSIAEGEKVVDEKNATGPADPPRHVSLLMRATLFLCGGIAISGWFLVAFGTAFTWIFIGQAHRANHHPKIEWAVAEGTITHIENSRRATAPDTGYYHFKAADGKRYTGTASFPKGEFMTGQALRVEYNASAPATSRPKEADTARDAAAFPRAVLIIPLTGIVAVIVGAIKAMKDYRLLVNGEMAVGELISKTATNKRVNNRRVYRMVFSFTDKKGNMHRTGLQTTQPAALQNDHYEALLYDSRHPSSAVMMDNLPGMPKIDGSGKVCVGNVLYSLPLLLPVAIIAENIFFAVKTLVF